MSKVVTIGNWKLQAGETRFLSNKQVEKLTNLVERWSAVETEIRKNDPVLVWAVKNLNVPTILCRVDLVPFGKDREPEKKLFEIEARPAGFGLLLQLIPKLSCIRSFWESLTPVGAVVLESRKIAAEDTLQFSQAMGWSFLQQYSCNNGINQRLWARGSGLDKNCVNLSKLEEWALAPLRSHGDKTYLLKMGLATPVSSENQLPWDDSFVVKPQKGSKSDKVFLWNPKERKKKTKGLYTKNKIVTALKQKEAFVLQPFFYPLEENHYGKRGFTIWRIYFGFDIRSMSWRFVGGLWNWRPCMKVHGASDAIFGPIILKNGLV